MGVIESAALSVRSICAWLRLRRWSAEEVFMGFLYLLFPVRRLLESVTISRWIPRREWRVESPQIRYRCPYRKSRDDQSIEYGSQGWHETCVQSRVVCVVTSFDYLCRCEAGVPLPREVLKGLVRNPYRLNLSGGFSSRHTL